MNYPDHIHDLSFSFGKMVGCAAIIFVVWVVLSLTTEMITSDAARTSRETCKIVSTSFTGVGATKDDKNIGISVQALCSFGKAIESSGSAKTTLEYALKRPSSIQCYQKKYRYTTVSRCDI